MRRTMRPVRADSTDGLDILRRREEIVRLTAAALPGVMAVCADERLVAEQAVKYAIRVQQEIDDQEGDGF